MRRILVSAIVLVLAGFSSAPAVRADDMKPATTTVQATTQLPRNVRPDQYVVTITPDAANLRFKGHVSVAIDVLQPTTAITLNAIDMDFSSVRLLLNRVVETPAAGS